MARALTGLKSLSFHFPKLLVPIETGLGTVQLVLNFSQKLGETVSTVSQSISLHQNLAVSSRPRALELGFLDYRQAQYLHMN